jgi:GxxExxY protein
MEHSELTEQIIGCAMKVHNALGPGFLESVYRAALAHELRKSGLVVELEKKIAVQYDGIIVGEFSADMLVAGTVLVEAKGIVSLAIAHGVQLVNYLTATGLDIGLLINFGGPRLEFKRKYRIYKPRSDRTTEGI